MTINHLSKSTQGQGLSNIVVEAIVDLAKESIRCYSDYLMCQEQEITERQRIKANLVAVTEKIKADKETYLKEIDKKFEERKYLYDIYNNAYIKAGNDGDRTIAKYALDMIAMVYCSGNSIHEQLVDRNPSKGARFLS